MGTRKYGREQWWWERELALCTVYVDMHVDLCTR